MERLGFKRFRSFIILIITVALVIFFHVVGILSPIEGVVIEAYGVVSRPVHSAGIEIVDFFKTFGNINQLRQTNKDLEAQVEELTADLVELEEIKRENEILREELDFSLEKDFVQEPALIIGREPAFAVKSLIINKGDSNGIKTGQPVISSTGHLVGRISDVWFGSARVKLITDSESVVNAMVQQSRATGLVHGEHGLGLFMDTIEKDSTVQKGDTVITSGLGGRFPKGLAVGVIEEVHESPNGLFQEGFVLPLVSFDDLEMLFIITDY
jgi:rod shape-determining protein MreC